MNVVFIPTASFYTFVEFVDFVMGTTPSEDDHARSRSNFLVISSRYLTTRSAVAYSRHINTWNPYES